MKIRRTAQKDPVQITHPQNQLQFVANQAGFGWVPSQKDRIPSILTWRYIPWEVGGGGTQQWNNYTHHIALGGVALLVCVNPSLTRRMELWWFRLINMLGSPFPEHLLNTFCVWSQTIVSAIMIKCCYTHRAKTTADTDFASTISAAYWQLKVLPLLILTAL